MKIPKLVLTVIVFLVSVLLCERIISGTEANQQNKQDSAEINHIKYGLFSIDQWKQQLAGIISEEIDDLNLTSKNEKELKKHVEMQLDGLIDNVDKKIRESNKGTAKGWMKQSFINAFVSIKDIKKGIPDYADAIVAQMTKAKTERKVKGILQKKVEGYLDKTFETQDLSRLDTIVRRMESADVIEARVKLENIIVAKQTEVFNFTWLLIGLSTILFAMTGFSKVSLPPAQYAILLLMLIVLLIAGVTTPMIDMEAKISELSFVLLDHPIKFTNQVLYFQSKSILDVFWIMITHKELQMKIVGILMVAFSIVFPLLKMLSSLAYFYDYRHVRENRVIKFFVLKSGKWSMTDVLIVAIFMSYIGFNGIISSQFGSFNTTDQEMVILTTNGTSLQPGFYLFLTYTMLALFLSGFLTRKQQI